MKALNRTSPRVHAQSTCPIFPSWLVEPFWHDSDFVNARFPRYLPHLPSLRADSLVARIGSDQLAKAQSCLGANSVSTLPRSLRLFSRQSPRSQAIAAVRMTVIPKSPQSDLVFTSKPTEEPLGPPTSPMPHLRLLFREGHPTRTELVSHPCLSPG